MTFTRLALLLSAVALAAPVAATNLIPGNLVVSVEGNGVWGAASGHYTDNQAAPLTLMQFSHAGTASAAYVNSIVLPQNGAGAISGEYGSSSEGQIQLTADGKHLVMMGYGVNAAAFNANPTAYGTAVNDPTKPTALGQSGSMTNAGYQAVARVVAVIDGDGSVDTSTRLYNIFNGNNPRSVASKDGKTFYVSGQGVQGDQTAGVFYATKGASSATAITGNDTATVKNGPRNATQDTRIVAFGPDGELLVSLDSKGGKDNARSFIGALGIDPTTLYNGGSGPTQLPGYGTSSTGKITLTAQTANGISAAGQEINLSPESFFFADPNTLYVADSGAPKQDSAKKSTGDGGLQKWIYNGTSWSLAYTVSAGLNLVANSSAHGTTGLLGLTGQVVNGEVQLFATNYTAGDNDQTYLFGLSDLLAATTKQQNEAFTILAAAPANSNFKGVAFAPSAAVAAVPEPMTYASMILGFALMGGAIRRRQRADAAAGA